MKTIRGIYENGKIAILEEIRYEKPQKILITFLDEEASMEEEEIRHLSFQQPAAFLEEYLSDQREDLYQEYAEKIPK